MHDNPDYLLEALDAGAAGYVLKDAPVARLVSAVRRTLNGESPLNQELATLLLRRLADERQHEPEPSPVENHQPPVETLTPRETEVLSLLTTGQTNQQIAESLNISKGTVKIHVEHIIRKLEVSDRTQAAVRAIELGFLARFGLRPTLVSTLPTVACQHGACGFALGALSAKSSWGVATSLQPYRQRQRFVVRGRARPERQEAESLRSRRAESEARRA